MVEVVRVGAILVVGVGAGVGAMLVGAKIIVWEVVGVGAIVVEIILAKAILVVEVRTIVVGVI